MEEHTGSVKIGYARVSTQDQKLDLQRNALTDAGCAEIFEDQTSGTRTTRPGLDKVLAKIGPGVVLNAPNLSRLICQMLMRLDASWPGVTSLRLNAAVVA